MTLPTLSIVFAATALVLSAWLVAAVSDAWRKADSRLARVEQLQRVIIQRLHRLRRTLLRSGSAPKVDTPIDSSDWNDDYLKTQVKAEDDMSWWKRKK